MGTDWRSVLLGATVMLGLDVGYFVITHEPTSSGILVGSAVSGYHCDRSMRGSAWHGALCGVLGTTGLVALVALGIVVGGLLPTIVADLLGVGPVGVLLAALLVISGSLPNAVTGALGGVARTAVNRYTR